MNKRYYEHTLPIIRGSLSNTYVESFGAAKVRKVLLERIIHGRKEKTKVFVSVVSDGKPNSRWKA